MTNSSWINGSSSVTSMINRGRRDITVPSWSSKVTVYVLIAKLAITDKSEVILVSVLGLAVDPSDQLTK